MLSFPSSVSLNIFQDNQSIKFEIFLVSVLCTNSLDSSPFLSDVTVSSRWFTNSVYAHVFCSVCQMTIVPMQDIYLIYELKASSLGLGLLYDQEVQRIAAFEKQLTGLWKWETLVRHN